MLTKKGIVFFAEYDDDMNHQYLSNKKLFPLDFKIGWRVNVEHRVDLESNINYHDPTEDF